MVYGVSTIHHPHTPGQPPTHTSTQTHAPVRAQGGQGVVGPRGREVEADGHGHVLHRGQVPREEQRPVVLGALVAVIRVGWWGLSVVSAVGRPTDPPCLSIRPTHCSCSPRHPVEHTTARLERRRALGQGPDAARLEPGRGRDDAALAAAAALGLLAPLAGAGGVAVVIGCVFRGVRGPSSWGRSLRAGIWAWGTYGASWPCCSWCGWCRAHGGRGASLCVYVHG